jgi:2-C-methyl-D-erythritol 4-phosphate cytidylyltransferase
MNVGVIIPAAGGGTRMGGVSKPFLELAGKPLLLHCLEAFLAVPDVQKIVVALPQAALAESQKFFGSDRIAIVEGGAQRGDSVRAGFEAMPADMDVIVVHDAARPLLSRAMIDAVIELAADGTCATIALQVSDTLHRVNSEGVIIETPDRAEFWRAQTPQAFPRSVLEQAYQRLVDVSGATDEAGLVVAAGFHVHVVPGDPSNIKITTPEDLELAEAALARRGA